MGYRNCLLPPSHYTKASSWWNTAQESFVISGGKSCFAGNPTDAHLEQRTPLCKNICKHMQKAILQFRGTSKVKYAWRPKVTCRDMLTYA